MKMLKITTILLFICSLSHSLYSKEDAINSNRVIVQVPSEEVRMYVTINATPKLQKFLEQSFDEIFKEYNIKTVRPDEEPDYSLSILGAERGSTGAISYNLFRFRKLVSIDGILKSTGNASLANWLHEQSLGNPIQNKLHLSRITENDVAESVRDAMTDYIFYEIYPWLTEKTE